MTLPTAFAIAVERPLNHEATSTDAPAGARTCHFPALCLEVIFPAARPSVNGERACD